MSKSATQRYRQAKAIAHEALELAGQQRSDCIDRQCAGDEELRAEVLWLMEAAEDATEDQVPEQFQAAARQALKDVSLEVPLPRNYRLVRRLNEGGMGVVYLAERGDGDMGQQVALKLLHLTEAPDEALARRFAMERQILSRLSHPNIARLIDGGLTADGRPFLATEFVDGDPIDQWIEHRHSRLVERLELFLKVCSAVDYAHRHMVIHRDLKPHNILVTPDGEPKLLDFGIARLLDQPDQTLVTREQTGQHLTLAYASPEQIEGGGLSAATDVYSLGVVLYQMLAGVRPFDHVEPAHLLPAAILGGEIVPPGKRNRPTPGKGIARVPQDLDAIAMHALKRQPDERYGSVKELAEDVQRFLDHRPVQARHNHAIYRARRFAWRHRFALAAALVITVMLVTFLVDREAQMNRIAWERDRAEAVTEFMTELFAGADSLPSRGNEVTVREILDLGTRQLSANVDYSPAMLGSIHLAIGRAYNALGLGEQALPWLFQAQTVLAGSIPAHEQAMIQAEVASALDSAGRAAEAIAAARLAIEGYQAAQGDFTADILRVRIRMLRNHANVLDVPLEQTLAELSAIVDQLEDQRQLPRELLYDALAALVGARIFQGSPRQALDTAARARDLANELFESDDPRRLRGRFVYVTALMHNDPEAAVAMYPPLIRDHERLIGPSQRLANTIGNFGVALSRVGRIRESIEAFKQATRMIEDVAGRDHYLYRLSISNLAALHLRQDEPREAAELIDMILPDQRDRYQRSGGVEAVYLASALDIKATAMALQGRLEEAAPLFAEALSLLEADNLGARPVLASSIADKLAEVNRQLARDLDG